MNCTVALCVNKSWAKGMCMMHYYRVKRGGTVDICKRQLKAQTNCGIDGCPKPHQSNGLCGMHLMRKRRNGDPLDPGARLFDGKAKERNYARTAAWKKTNKKEYNVYLAARKSRIKKATPPWADLESIEQIYRARENAEVDHIIPITHPGVCGLHVPWNLQYLSPLDNNQKNNAFDGTYENESWTKKAACLPTNPL